MNSQEHPGIGEEVLRAVSERAVDEQIADLQGYAQLVLLDQDREQAPRQILEAQTALQAFVLQGLVLRIRGFVPFCPRDEIENVTQEDPPPSPHPGIGTVDSGEGILLAEALVDTGEQLAG